MNKFVLTNGTEIEIKEGASLENITAVAVDFTALGLVADALLVSGNLDSVKFKTDETVTGAYALMKFEPPLFRAVDIDGGIVQATFSIRKKTEMELAIEELQTGQVVQDGAIGDLGTVVSEIDEGGTV